MTDEQMRVKIAEACPFIIWGESNPPEPWWHWGIHFILFDPPNDLNACHEMEKVLSLEKQYDYGEQLRVMSGNIGERGGHFVPNGIGCFHLAHLTARQRCEAFLRTIGQWEEQ